MISPGRVGCLMWPRLSYQYCMLFKIELTRQLYRTLQERNMDHAVLWCSISQFYPHSLGLLYWHWGNHLIASVPVKQPWSVWANKACKPMWIDNITLAQQIHVYCSNIWANKACKPMRNYDITLAQQIHVYCSIKVITSNVIEYGGYIGLDLLCENIWAAYTRCKSDITWLLINRSTLSFPQTHQRY